MPPDPHRLRAVVEHLEAIERPSASAGERRAAEWLRDRLEALGAPARVEAEPATGLVRRPRRAAERRSAPPPASPRGARPLAAARRARRGRR